MLGTTTTTATTVTAAMSLSSNPEITSIPTSSKASIDSPNGAMQPFTPGQCLFCPKPSPSFADSVVHMQKSHGLFVPHRQHLVVDLETLFKFLHLVIFGYRECIDCGTERATVQAVQQHMTGKGHCRFDISERDSEFSEFYDFSEPEDDTGSDVESDYDTSPGETAPSPGRKPVMADEDSIRLPSGRIISRQSTAQAGPSFTQLRRRIRNAALQLEDSVAEAADEEGSGREGSDPDTPDTRLLSRRERRERATTTHQNQMAGMSAGDRNSLMHLPAAEQRSLLAAQHRNAEKVQKKEKRRQSKVDRKGNKNLYAYWHTETPVYMCG
ncbi:Cytoplasmic 60S subunit biogenesis factor [Colletotrichum tanaceti]|uniref:Cytoplasmic 60S subunit biogenesis factor n=1 Tax=Colletotrichum tanaceti TaxID=1306861 RepID=A0A4U6X3N7_9PEZI|nr:Cytoplasmic 60S subunit biogenesis factor [Colletotrichum tanaceti]TKW49980.1 Cytoplasmic 60S subunit biogenesis factor [Colletotrichum tanaceti]